MDVDDPEEGEVHFLGCDHRPSDRTHEKSGKRVKAMTYDMKAFLIQCLEKFKELTGIKSLKSAPTPFLEDTPIDRSGEYCPGCGNWTIHPGHELRGAKTKGTKKKKETDVKAPIEPEIQRGEGDYWEKHGRFS